MTHEIRPKIGLALGSGGSKGLSHIGVLKVLIENNIPIDFIAGSSIGAIIGGFYAAQKDINEIEQIALKHNWPQLFSFIFDPSFSGGILRGKKVRAFIERYVRNHTFSRLKIPFVAVATDLSSAAYTPINHGDVTDAIMASAAIPPIFKPVIIGSKLYTDGGISMPVPVTVVRDMGADIVIAVNLYEHYSGIEQTERVGIGMVGYRSLDILTHYLSRENVRHADIVVAPKVGSVGLFDKFLTQQGTEDVITEGERAMRDMLPELQMAIKLRTIISPEKRNLLRRILHRIPFIKK